MPVDPLLKRKFKPQPVAEGVPEETEILAEPPMARKKRRSLIDQIARGDWMYARHRN